MTTSADLAEFIKSLPNQIVPLDNPAFKSIDLNILVKDAGDEPLHLWWEKKKMTPRLSKIIAMTLLSLDPPEEIKNAILLTML